MGVPDDVGLTTHLEGRDLLDAVGQHGLTMVMRVRARAVKAEADEGETSNRQ